MFPPAIAIPATLASFAAVWFALHALAGVRPIHLGWRAAVAALTVVLFSLLLRVYDELKDVETDLRLGRAGILATRIAPWSPGACSWVTSWPCATACWWRWCCST